MSCNHVLPALYDEPSPTLQLSRIFFFACLLIPYSPVDFNLFFAASSAEPISFHFLHEVGFYPLCLLEGLVQERGAML
jgi:hypothetical protein